MDYRIEKDTMGEVKVPLDKYWAAQTQRSLHNFKIGHEKMPLEIVHGFAYLKKACALVNYQDKIKLKKVLYLSYRLNDEELSKKLNIQYEDTPNEKFEDYDLLKDLENFNCEELYNFNIFIEGVEFDYLKSNFDAIFIKLAELKCLATRFHINIINVPIEQQEKLAKKIDEALPSCGRLIKQLRPDREHNIEVYTRTKCL